jgi:hypothetical protein
MPKRTLLFPSVLLLISLVAAGFSSAANRKGDQPRVRVATAEYRVTLLRSTSNYPAVGETGVYTGLVKRRLGGRVTKGAAVARNTITDITGNVVTSKSRITSYYAGGTNKHRGTSIATFQPDGSIELEGEGKVTGGTGKWRGLRGSYRTTGSQACFDCPLVFDGKARLKH